MWDIKNKFSSLHLAASFYHSPLPTLLVSVSPPCDSAISFFTLSSPCPPLSLLPEEMWIAAGLHNDAECEVCHGDGSENPACSTCAFSSGSTAPPVGAERPVTRLLRPACRFNQTKRERERERERERGREGEKWKGGNERVNYRGEEKINIFWN